jgi:hypothetical protein
VGQADVALSATIFLVISVLGIILQQIVFHAGYVGWDSAALDNSAAEVLRSFRLAGDPSIILVPNDPSGALVDFDALMGRKVSYFSVHFSPSYYLFALFRSLFSAWTAGGLYALSMWVAFASIFVYWTLRGLDFTPIFSAFFTLLLFIGPLGSGAVVNAPHPVTVGITYVAAATCFYVWRSWPWYWIAFLLSVFTQSSIGVFFLSASVLMMRRDRLVGIATLVLAGVSVVVASKAVEWVVLAESVIEQRKLLENGSIGPASEIHGLSGPLALIAWTLEHPIEYVATMLRSHLPYHLLLVSSLAFLVIFPSFEGALVLLVAAHQKLLLILGVRSNLMLELHWHYSSLLVPATVLVIVAWRFKGDRRETASRNLLHLCPRFRTLGLVKMAVMFAITSAAYVSYGQWWGSTHWFSVSKASLRKTQPTDFFDVKGSIVASTARPSTGFAYRNQMFSADRVFSPHMRWPRVQYAVLPSDYVSDEWSNVEVAEIAMMLRAIVERRNFTCLASHRGYTLWAAPGVGAEHHARPCDVRLTRNIPAEVPQSRRPLHRDSNGWYREADGEDRTIFYGPYQPLYPTETTEVTVEVEPSPRFSGPADAPAFSIELRAGNGDLIQSNLIKRGELNSGPHLTIPRSNLLLHTKYQINVVVDVMADPTLMKFRGLRIVSHDPILEHPATVALRVIEGKNRLNALVPAGNYRILGGTHRPDGLPAGAGESRIVVSGDDFQVEKGRNRARFTAMDLRPPDERTLYGTILLQLLEGH